MNKSLLTTLVSTGADVLKLVVVPRRHLEVSKEELKEIESEANPFLDSSDFSVDRTVPKSMRVAAAWSWRFLAITAALVLVGLAAWQLYIVIIPVLVALLLAVLLEPVLYFFYRILKLPRTLAATLSLLIGIGVVVGMVYVATTEIISGVGDVVERAQLGVQTAINWLTDGPLHLERATINNGWYEIQIKLRGYIGANASYLASNALSTASSIMTLAAGLLTSIFCLFFFLKDGRKIWQWFLRLLPQNARNPINEAAIRGWVTLGSYARAQTTVAALDALGIGIGAYLLGVPLALPLGVIVFMAAFIPFLGAIISGFLATMVALVDQGPTTALIMMLIILAVQQIESNILQPALMSNAVNIHPVAVFLVVTAGGYTLGIAGAIFSVPILAFINTTVMYLRGYDKFIALNYDYDRPGGPPGCLDEEIAKSLRPTQDNLEAAHEMRKKAIKNGHIPQAAPVTRVEAEEASLRAKTGEEQMGEVCKPSESQIFEEKTAGA